jgi:hypothetical protein
MLPRKSMKQPFTKTWALVFLSLLISVGLYFGFHAITVPAQTPADQAQAAIPSLMTVSFPSIDFETSIVPEMRPQSVTSWLLQRVSDIWFRSVLYTLAILLIMLIVMTLSIVTSPSN